jgi:hypothetical protein
MKLEILAILAGVRRRQQQSRAVQMAVWGLLAGAVVGIGVGVWKLAATQPIAPWMAAVLLLAGPVVGLIAGLVWRRHLHAAAIAVDWHYRLKDRAVTALEFVEREAASPLKELQVGDAAAHLKQVDPRSVVPFRLPRAFPYAVGTLAVAVTLLFWPLNAPEAQAKPLGPLPGVVMAAEEIEKGLDELEKVAEEEQSEELKELVEELREEVDAMKLPGVELKEALEKISEMQERMAQEQAEYNESLMDAQLKSVGGAMMAASDFQGAGSKLEEQEYDAAAEELEQLEQVNLQRKEQKALQEKLASLSASADQMGLGQLADTLSEMCEGLESGSSSQVSEQCKKLARQTRQHQRRKTINSLLRMQCNKLSECKGMCKNNVVAPPMLVQEKSDKPSEKWGTATTGDPFGDKTQLAAAHKVEEITGQAGDGPSEVEITYSPEGQEQARRGYQESYDNYQQMAEAVLDSEPIPLGHRQTIRTYFELIRPGQGDEAADEPAAE